MDFDADDTNWYAAKEVLNSTLKGRQIVEYTEKNIKTNSIFLFYSSLFDQKERLRNYGQIIR